MFDEWNAVTEIPRLGSEVQVWQIDLDQQATPEAEYLRHLSEEEVERAGRLRAGQVRMQFLAGRTWLRTLLGAELAIVPKDVTIIAGEYGKPELDRHNRGSIHFNVAHARSTILVAISLMGPLGIDVEYMDRSTDVLGVARHSLTEREKVALLTIRDVEQRHRSFFQCWTRKEAVVKGDGRGLSLPLTSFEVPMGKQCQSFPIEIPSAAGGPSARFFLSDLTCNDQTSCSIAVAGSPRQFRLLTLASV